MMQRLAGLKIAAICLCFVALLACSKKTSPNLETSARPGTVEDFQVNVGDRIYFLEDQSTLTAEAQETLRKQAAWLRQYPSVTVQVEGHADERGTREYNIALSARRATATREFLIAQGISGKRIASIAYGKERPVAMCDAEQCWSQNRRAVTVITGGARGS